MGFIHSRCMLIAQVNQDPLSLRIQTGNLNQRRLIAVDSIQTATDM